MSLEPLRCRDLALNKLPDTQQGTRTTGQRNASNREMEGRGRVLSHWGPKRSQKV